MNDKKNYKILIVDDQQKNIQVLGSLLRQQKYIIGVATNGQRAIEILLESNNYDLVLLDVNMPVMNGFEACKAIREHQSLKEIPIIFITAMADTDSIVKGFEVGGQDYVTKPFGASELLARVNTHLQLKHNKDILKQVNSWLEKKVAERTLELEIANNQLLELDAAKSEFLKIISHEIRTPLNGIIGVLEILNEFPVPDELKEWINIMSISANRLEEFSYKALDISMFNSKTEELLSLNPTNLNEVITTNVNALKARAEKKNITVVQENDSEDCRTMLDNKYINNCFTYLIDNAIKFAKENSQVSIKLTTTNGNFLVVIEDEGKLFPDDFDISRLTPFSTKSHIDQNPALSLFLSKQIIEAHKGYIETENTPTGAKVKVVIPKTGYA
ncbi:hybrid sensor histidine kinase/response regulator [Aequorivita sp. F47161]|uniref:histidine kinase n=1 Tax=Aequorivita vitellina TaxID=2874475 RepID=A0A9X1U3L6_9FLAO|nr:hybrid sensor histidine kinase/response regulator [Aequorivita vitellina]MCG2419688.1 hybrid sensor histidine kinase/response regulator [Aequorivita vitellina]